MIIRRHLPLLIALLLPLMVMRGLLPAGFMAVSENGNLRFEMCSAGLAQPGDTDNGSDDRRSSDPSTCLFAHAASVAPPVAIETAFGAHSVPAHPAAVEPSVLPPATGPPRLAAARAPPSIRI